MVRFVLIAAIVIVAIIVFPYAMAPGINSADLIVIAAPMAILAVGRPRRRSTGTRPVSEHYRQARAGGLTPQQTRPRTRGGAR